MATQNDINEVLQKYPQYAPAIQRLIGGNSGNLSVQDLINSISQGAMLTQYPSMWTQTPHVGGGGNPNPNMLPGGAAIPVT